MKYNDKDIDELRLNDLAKQHGLKFKRPEARIYLMIHGAWIAAGTWICRRL
jgi:hypothetical protein